MYGEVRLDLPGDQRLAVGAFLSKFPGFADQASLETKLNEVLDDLVKQATQQAQTYTTDIKPWFGGELAFAVGPLPPPASVSNGDTSAMSAVRMLALVSIKDAAAAQAWLDAAVAKSGSKTTSETYNGATLSVFEAVGGVQPAYALIDGKVAAIGDIASVKGAVDTKGAGAFSKEDGPKAALASSTGDHVGFMYVALRPLMDWSNALSKLQSTQLGSTPLTLGDSLFKAVPDWGAFALRFQSNAIVLEADAPLAATPLGPTENRVSSLAEHIPSNAVVASITNDYGKTIKQALDLYRSEPSFKPVFDQIDKALGLVGGTDAAIGWVGDTAIVVTVPDGTPEGGLIVAPTDKAAAQHLFTSLQVVHRDRRRPARCHGPRRDLQRHDHHDRRRRGHRQAVTGDRAGSRHVAIRPHRDRLRHHRQRRRPWFGTRLRQARARYHQGHLARVECALPDAGRSGRRGDGHEFRRHRRDPRSRREVRSRCQGRPGRSGQVRERRQAVPRPVRRPVRIRDDWFRRQPFIHLSHRQVAGRNRASNQRRNRSTHGSPHQADARRRDQAADLSGRRRRRPQRPRWASDRDHRALQPPDGPRRVRGRRREGAGLDREGRPAVRYRPSVVPQRGHRARSQVGSTTMAAKDLVEYVAKSLVDDPAAVTVEVVEEDGATVIELHVAEDDMGKVIGRNGSVAKALRTLLKVTAARDGEPVQLEIL